MIKPDFFFSESMSSCDYMTRLCFIGLWVNADDNGNMKDSRRKLRAQIFPYDPMPDSDFDRCLDALRENDCIELYEVDGERYIHVTNFGVYQTINRPSKTLIPTPEMAVDNGHGRDGRCG